MSIIDELLREFPDLAPQKRAIEKIIATMEQSASPPVLDDTFVQRLRNELMTKEFERPLLGVGVFPSSHLPNFITSLLPTPLHPSFIYSFFSHMQQKTFALLGAALTVLVLAPAGYMLVKNHGGGTLSNLFAPSASTITILDAGAFGSLANATASGVQDGKGGGGMMSSISSSEFSASPVAAPAIDAKMVTSDMMIAPGEPYPYEPTVYVYTFDGDLSQYLTDTSATVYERQAATSPSASTLNSIARAFSSLNLDTFLAGKLSSFVLSQNGYMLSIDIPGNTWSIYKDWTTYVYNEAWKPLTAADLPSDEAIFSAAKDFATTWSIDLSSYGEPVIAEPEIMLARAGTTDTYIPESATVVFPTLVEGNNVYPSWGSAPTGLRISVNLRDLSVSNAYDALSHSYNASAYTLTQDSTLITTLLAGGGSAPITYEGMSINEINVPVQAPERVLMEYSLYENGTSRTLFVPALRFTLSDATQVPWTSGTVTVPLVQEIAELQNQNNGGSIMPMVK